MKHGPRGEGDGGSVQLRRSIAFYDGPILRTFEVLLETQALAGADLDELHEKAVLIGEVPVRAPWAHFRRVFQWHRRKAILAVYAIYDGKRILKPTGNMISHKIAKALMVSSAFVLVGGGCTLFGTKEPATPPVEEVEEVDESGDTLSEQADIIVDAVLDESEADADGDVESDASFFTSDEQELNNMEKSYEEDEL